VGNVGEMRETYIYMEHIWNIYGQNVGRIMETY
jgi:hypothetical protein